MSTKMKEKKINYKVLVTQIWMQYYKEYTFVFDNCSIAHCYLKEKEIHFPIKNFKDPSKREVFDLLHEIGHLKTNKKGMKRCEEEFYATQWAIKQMKKYNFDLNKKDKEIFQDYIYKWRETGIKLKGKMPDKESLILEW